MICEKCNKKKSQLRRHISEKTWQCNSCLSIK